MISVIVAIIILMISLCVIFILSVNYPLPSKEDWEKQRKSAKPQKQIIKDYENSPPPKRNDCTRYEIMDLD